jgi:hypothetical protein
MLWLATQFHSTIVSSIWTFCYTMPRPQPPPPSSPLPPRRQWKASSPWPWPRRALPLAPARAQSAIPAPGGIWAAPPMPSRCPPPSLPLRFCIIPVQRVDVLKTSSPQVLYFTLDLDWLCCAAVRRWTWASTTAATRGGPYPAAHPLVRLSAPCLHLHSPRAFVFRVLRFLSRSLVWLIWARRGIWAVGLVDLSMLCGSVTCLPRVEVGCLLSGVDLGLEEGLHWSLEEWADLGGSGNAME